MSMDAAIRGRLRELELEHYADSFEAEAITVDLLPHLSDSDLTELGVASLGHRKRMLSAWAVASGESSGLPSIVALGGSTGPAEAARELPHQAAAVYGAERTEVVTAAQRQPGLSDSKVSGFLTMLAGILAVAFDIYWMTDGGVKLLGLQGLLLAMMGIVVGLILVVRGIKMGGWEFNHDLKATETAESKRPNLPPPVVRDQEPDGGISRHAPVAMAVMVVMVSLIGYWIVRGGSSKGGSTSAESRPACRAFSVTEAARENTTRRMEKGYIPIPMPEDYLSCVKVNFTYTKCAQMGAPMGERCEELVRKICCP